MPAPKPTRDAAAKNRAYVAKHRKRRKEEAIDCILRESLSESSRT